MSVIMAIKVGHGFGSVRLRLLFTKAVALLAYRLSSSKRRSSEKNLSTAFNDQLSKERIRAIVKGSFFQFWLDLFTMPYGSDLEGEARPVSVYGLEHLQESLKRGDGAILWESSYFGRRNLAKHILYQNGFAVDQVHASNHMAGFGTPRDNQSWATERVIRPFFDNCERSFVREIIYLGDSDSLSFTKLLVSRLRKNRILCISADGTRGHKFISVSLLGRTVSLPTGAVSLARITNAPIFPLFCFADASGGTKLTILPPLQISSASQREEVLENGVRQFVALLESYVRMYPEQYRKWDYSRQENGRWIPM